jgi:poly(A) polymerase
LKLIIDKAKNILQHVYKTSRDVGIEAFAVGGFVRDLYLSKEGTDIDFVIIGDAIQFAERFKDKYNGGNLVTYPRFGTAMLYYKNYKLEFITARTEKYNNLSRKPYVKKADLHSDLSRRDFTINTLAMRLSPDKIGEVLDFYHGIDDINQSIIRTPLDPVVTFSDDPLRILRAVRFATVLNFKIEGKTYEAILETAERIKIVSQERITEELKKILLASKPSTGFYLMQETGLLKVILPELEQLIGVEQREEYHHKDVFNHTMKVLDNIAEIEDNYNLRLAALLHDIAKPQTKKFIKEKGWTFHGHEDLGARMVEKIGRRMRWSLETIKYVQKLVRLHLRPMQLIDELVTDSAIRRLMVEAGENIEDLMSLCRADITSKNPEKVKKYLTNFDIVENRMNQVEEKDKLRNFKLAIDGNTIMDTLNIPPGPIVGQIKEAIKEAVLEGDISNNKKECFEYFLNIKDQYLEQ